MQKLFSYLLVIYLLSCLSLLAQPAIQWQQSYGGNLNDYATHIENTSDGGSVVIGYTESNTIDVSGNHGGKDYWILKINSSSSILWKKCLGGTSTEWAYDIKQADDNGYIIAGHSFSNDGNVTGLHGTCDFWIVKTDSVGNIEWEKAIGGSNDDGARSIQKTIDGGYIVAGYTSSNNGDVTGLHGSRDFWIVKLNSNGTITWQKSYGGTYAEYAYSIKQTTDGGFITVGQANSSNGDITGNHGLIDIWVLKIDMIGNIQWQKSLGGNQNEIAYDVIQNLNGEYLIAGYTESNNGDATGNHGSADGWIIKLDTFGNIIWQRCYGGSGSEFFRSIIQTGINTYAISGYCSSNGGDVYGYHGGLSDYWIITIDSLSSIIWQKTLGGSDFEGCNSIIQSPDGGFILAGSTHSIDGDVTSAYGNDDYWIVKLFCNQPISNFSTSSASICSGSNINFTNISTGYGLYQWQINGITISNSTNFNYTFGTSGIYIISLIAGGQNCVDTSSQTITVKSLPITNFTQLEANYCANHSAINLIGSPPAGIYSGNGISGNIFDPSNAGFGTHSIIYTITDSTGCIGSSAQSVVVNSLPLVNFSGLSSNYCSNTLAENIIGSPTGGIFSGSGISGNSFNPNNADIGIDTITYFYTDNYGCSNSNSQTTTVVPFLLSSSSSNILICNGEAINLVSSGEGNFLWNTGDTTQTIIVSPTVTTIYSVTASNFCVHKIDSITINVNPLPVITISNDTTILLGNSVNLNTMGGTFYSWSPQSGLSCSDCPNPIATPQSTTTYSITISNANGCSVTKAITITVKDDFEIFIPDVFSPNGDGENDILYVRGTGIKEFNFVVYDRLGEKIFESNSLSLGWDGTYKGSPLNSAVFIYYLSATLFNDKKIKTKGDITLIR